jgi:hypothetical protein
MTLYKFSCKICIYKLQDYDLEIKRDCLLIVIKIFPYDNDDDDDNNDIQIGK